VGADETTSGTTVPGRLEELSPADCWELLEERAVGRVAYCNAGEPTVLPVNYTVRTGSIVFRTRVRGRLADAMNDLTAAFEVDDVDEHMHAGWSVLLVGLASWVTDTEELSDLWWDQHQPEPWAAGERNVFVRIVPTKVTGRRLGAA
jgi:nitroimidazol reductase NimA-like FMN-containing flavoprotein (pyridoxamine 5'-phosphate oxidase superfamily)